MEKTWPLPSSSHEVDNIHTSDDHSVVTSIKRLYHLNREERVNTD